MSAELLYTLCGTALVALGLFVLIAIAHLLRKLLAFNIVASGIFLILTGLGQLSGEPDPVPQALVLTGIVVAFASTALALTLLRRWYRISGRFTIEPAHRPVPPLTHAARPVGATPAGEDRSE